MKNELLGKDELSISVGGVDFTASKIAEMIRSHTQQNKKDAEILRAQMIELDRVKALLDEAVEIIKLCKSPNRADKEHSLLVKSLGDKIGYGALMSEASYQWGLLDEGRGGQFSTGPCFHTVENFLQKLKGGE